MTSASPSPLAAPERGFRVYAYMLGVVTTLLVIVEATLDFDLIQAEVLPIVIFALFIGFAWYFSFTIFPRASLSISLDMAYLMTALCVLPSPLPLVVAFAGAALGCYLRWRDKGNRANPVLLILGLNVGSLVTTAFAGQILARFLKPLWQFHVLTWNCVAVIAALFVVYNLTNLAVMGTAVVLRREPLLPYLATYLKFIPSLEIFTIPLSLGLALLYAGTGIWGFTPMATTILLASGLLKKLNAAQTELSDAIDQVRNRSKELSILNTIGSEITSSLDPEVVFEKVSANLQKILDAPYLFLSLYQKGPQETYIEFVARDGRVQPRPDRALGHGFTTWMVETRRHLLVGDMTVDRDSIPCAPVLLDPSVRSILASPLIVNSNAIGVLCVESPRPAAYSVDQASVFTTIAQQAAIAIENARNYELATVDQLTRLYLRDHFFRKVSEEQVRSRRYGSIFAVLMLDLDSFKEINDRMGHLAGDRFLQRVGEAIRETMRGADVPCRYGGEEFCVLLPETDLEGARKIAERIRGRVSGLEVRVGEAVIRTTISAGISCYPADYPGTIPGLLEKADQALYAAKQGGRDRVVAAAAMPGKPPGSR